MLDEQGPNFAGSDRDERQQHDRREALVALCPMVTAAQRERKHELARTTTRGERCSACSSPAPRRS